MTIQGNRSWRNIWLILGFIGFGGACTILSYAFNLGGANRDVVKMGETLKEISTNILPAMTALHQQNREEHLRLMFADSSRDMRLTYLIEKMDTSLAWSKRNGERLRRVEAKIGLQSYR